MKSLCLFALAFAAFGGYGCTTLRPSVLSADELRRQISLGELLKPGDDVRLTTMDGAVHEFAVMAVDTDAGLVVGSNESVRIADIVGAGKRELAVGKTVLSAGCSLVPDTPAVSAGIDHCA